MDNLLKQFFYIQNIQNRKMCLSKDFYVLFKNYYEILLDSDGHELTEV